MKSKPKSVRLVVSRRRARTGFSVKNYDILRFRRTRIFRQNDFCPYNPHILWYQSTQDQILKNFYPVRFCHKPPPSQETPDKPNADQLQKVASILQSSLEKTFTHPMDYSIYHPDIVFIDNIRNIRTQGLNKYIQHIALLKTVGHLKFAFVRFEILNMHTSHEEGRITVRWSIKGLSGIRVMFKFWKYKLWKWSDIMNHQETWYDGVSYFDVGGDGKVFRHIADKVMEDKDRQIDDKPRGGGIPLAAKLGALATVFPTPSSLMHGNASHSSTVAGAVSSLFSG